jgi:hypothetical protein
MNANKRNRILYWTLTLLVLIPTAGSAIPELFGAGAQATIHSYQVLGYPLYLMKILGVAKLLGAVAILVNQKRNWSEWAYAGFGILLLGATASHLLSGDLIHAPFPLVFFFLLVGSYVYWRKNSGVDESLVSR